METKKQIEEWKHRRSLRIREKRKAMAQYNRDRRNDADGENEESGRKARSGNTHLPYGLCKKNGIDLPAGATPYDAWQALKGKGIAPPWEEGKEAEKAKEQLPNYSEKGNTEQSKPAFNIQEAQNVISNGEASDEEVEKVLNGLADNTILDCGNAIKFGKIDGEWKKIYPSGSVADADIDIIVNKIAMKAFLGKPYNIMENGLALQDVSTSDEELNKLIEKQDYEGLKDKLNEMPSGTEIGFGDAVLSKYGDNWKMKNEALGIDFGVAADEIVEMALTDDEKFGKIKAPAELSKNEPKESEPQGSEWQGSEITESSTPSGQSIEDMLENESAEAIGEKLEELEEGYHIFEGLEEWVKTGFGNWSSLLYGTVMNDKALASELKDAVAIGTEIDFVGKKEEASKEAGSVGTLENEQEATEKTIQDMYNGLKSGNLLSASYALVGMEIGTKVTTPAHSYIKTEEGWLDDDENKVKEWDITNDMMTATAKYVSVVPPKKEKSSEPLDIKTALSSGTSDDTKKAVAALPEGHKMKIDNEVYEHKGGKWVSSDGKTYDDEEFTLGLWVMNQTKIAKVETNATEENTKAKASTKAKTNTKAMNDLLDAAGDIGTDGYDKALDIVLGDMNVGDVIKAPTSFGNEIFKKTESGFANGISGKSVTADTIKEKMAKATGKAQVAEGENANNYNYEPYTEYSVKNTIKNAYATKDHDIIQKQLEKSLTTAPDGTPIYAFGDTWKKQGEDYINQKTGEALNYNDIAKAAADDNAYVCFNPSDKQDKGIAPKKSLVNIGKKIKNAFTKSAYSKQRKDNAVWAVTEEQKKDLNAKSLKGALEWKKKVGQSGVGALWFYTAGSGNTNASLRQRVDNAHDGAHHPSDNDYKRALELRKAISESTLAEDTWLQRAVGKSLASYNFGISKQSISKAFKAPNPQEALEKLFMGREGHDAAFMSCGTGKGNGFTDNVMLNIYCPKGTSAVYANPYSAFAHHKGAGSKWNGETDIESVSGEFETLLNAGTRFKVTKVKYEYGRVWLDVDVIGQDDYSKDPVTI